MKIIKYNEEKISIWNDFVDESKNGLFMFNRNYMDYHKDRFIDNSLMFYNDNDELIALLPINIKNNVLYSHNGLTYGGFIVNSDMKQRKMIDCFESLTTYMRNNGINKLVYKTVPYIYYKYPSNEDIYALYKFGAKVLKQEPSTTVLLNESYKMPKGRKAQISRAKREGIVIKESEDFVSFIDLENTVLSEHHKTEAVHNSEELKLLHNNFPENIKLFIAEYNGKMIAATLLFIYENVVHTQYMASNDVGREIGALDYLISELMNVYRESKMYFDFGISTEDNGKILNEGLISQKEGFGGRTVVYTAYELVI